MQIAFSVIVAGVTLHSVTPVNGRCVTDEVTGLSHGVQQPVRQDNIIDADDMALRDAGGRTFTLRFTGHKWHGDNATAAAFVAAHPGTMPVGGGSASVTVGATTTSYARGYVTKCDCTQADTETITQYEVLLTESAA